jgi:tetratricopeptide (TPR) repeat protein
MRRGTLLLFCLGLLGGCASAPRHYSHYDMAMVYKGQNKLDKAIAEFQASIAVDPNDPTVYNALAELYYAQGNRDGAIDAWEKALGCGSTDPSFYQKGTAKRSVAWIGDAVKAFQAAQDEIIKPYMEAAGELDKEGRWAEAIVIWGKVVAIQKDNLEAWSDMAKANKKLNNIPAAFDDYKAASQLNPKDISLQKNYGYMAFSMMKLNEAEDAFRKWTELDPTNPLSFNNLGAVLAKLERYDEAYAAFDKALAEQPDMVAALNGKATAYYYQKNYDEARKIWGHVLELAPDDPTATENIRTLVKMGY